MSRAAGKSRRHRATDELKTKPTQHSVNELRRIGIQPDILICRADYEVSRELREKISLFGDVREEAVIPLPTSDTIRCSHAPGDTTDENLSTLDCDPKNF